jgi:hypothetical protein
MRGGEVEGIMRGRFSSDRAQCGAMVAAAAVANMHICVPLNATTSKCTYLPLHSLPSSMPASPPDDPAPPELWRRAAAEDVAAASQPWPGAIL